jgi:monoamine oxidase
MDHIDVVIIGAGLSGLRTASLLKRNGYSVRVLEALNRVGGRLKGVKDKDGYLWDVGGQWVGHQQVSMRKLLEEYKITLIPQYDDTVGKLVVVSDNPPKKLEVSGSDQMVYSANCIDTLNQMASELGTNWWEHPKAAEWDSVTVAQWVKSNFPHEKNIYATPTGTQALIAVEESQVSLLFLLVWVNRCTGVNGEPGNFDNPLLTKGGAQEWVIAGGAWGLCSTIYEKELKDIVRLNSPVSKIYHDDHGVTVVTSDGYICRALHAVITAPPNVVNKMTFYPAIPTRRRLNECMPMGSVIKAFVKYESAYWHMKGFSGNYWNT